MFCIEYMQAGSGVPVDCTVGLRDKPTAIVHGRKISTTKGYCGFWISRKPDNSYNIDPVRLEFHPVIHSPTGRITYGRVIYQKPK